MLDMEQRTKSCRYCGAAVQVTGSPDEVRALLNLWRQRHGSRLHRRRLRSSAAATNGRSQN